MRCKHRMIVLIYIITSIALVLQVLPSSLPADCLIQKAEHGLQTLGLLVARPLTRHWLMYRCFNAIDHYFGCQIQHYMPLVITQVLLSH